MRKQRKFWTRERIIESLKALANTHGQIEARDYDPIAKEAGRGMGRADRPYPTAWTIRLEFGSLGEAFVAAGVEPPTGWKPRASRKPALKASRPRSVAFVSAEDAAASRALDAAAVLGRSITEQAPCPDCAALRSDRDELAWALGQLLTGGDTAIRLVRAGKLAGDKR